MRIIRERALETAESARGVCERASARRRRDAQRETQEHQRLGQAERPQRNGGARARALERRLAGRECRLTRWIGGFSHRIPR